MEGEIEIHIQQGSSANKVADAMLENKSEMMIRRTARAQRQKK
jgi:hypothetical protein